MRQKHVESNLAGVEATVACDVCEWWYSEPTSDRVGIAQVRSAAAKHVRETQHRVTGRFTDIVEYRHYG